MRIIKTAKLETAKPTIENNNNKKFNNTMYACIILLLPQSINLVLVYTPMVKSCSMPGVTLAINCASC